MTDINFDNIHDQTVDIHHFELSWRFIDPNYNLLPQKYLESIKPLNAEGAKFLSDFIINAGLHKDFPFTKGFFETEDSISITHDNGAEVKAWLQSKQVSPDKRVFLSWSASIALVTSFKILVEYFDDFYYSSSDDLTVFDERLDWALLFFHTDDVYWGSGRK